MRVILQHLLSVSRRYHRIRANLRRTDRTIKQGVRTNTRSELKTETIKCSICVREVEFLGHIVTKGQLAMLPDKISRISTWPQPRNVRDV